MALLSDEEAHQLLVEWNDTRDEWTLEHVHELFEQQVRRTPHEVAIVFEQEEVSYAELNRRANQVGHYLRGQGVGAEVAVGVCVERSVEMVVGLLGVLKAGGVYVPLDATYPQERLAFMMEDSGVSVLLAQQHLVERLPAHQAVVVCIDSDWPRISKEPDTNLGEVTSTENLAYIIYTSGSTGKPKGVLVPHRAVANRLLWAQAEYPLTEQDSVLQIASFGFDFSVWEIFGPLIAGARVVMARPGGQQDIVYLVETIAQQKITTVHFVPSMLQVFLEERGVETCRHLKRVFCGGEALPFHLQEQFFERFDADLYNQYGPTEAAIDVTFRKCERESERRQVPIGRPISNTQIYVLDSRMQPVAINMPGELHIGGDNLARGYGNRPELTAMSFVPNPFSDEPGTRLYKTGDLARYRPDGQIEYLGRIDQQVKLRGYRIELQEIEAAICMHEGIQDAIVLVREDVPGSKRLVGYHVAATEGQPPGVEELRQFLKDKLPEYMVPSAFVGLDALPFTPGGKVDRRALPAPDQFGHDSETPFIAPRTSTEERLAEIWTGLLRIEEISVNQNFFELGGHSLLATQVMSRIRQAFKIELPLRFIFELPTISSLAAKLNAGTDSKKTDIDEIALMLEDIEQLSSDEIMKLMEERLAQAENV